MRAAGRLDAEAITDATTASFGYDEAMRFGIATFITDEGIRPDVLGRALEERGFSSLFIAEHPTSRSAGSRRIRGEVSYQVASLDVVSDGRVAFGVGVG